jgi:hypothetical protein
MDPAFGTACLFFTVRVGAIVGDRYGGRAVVGVVFGGCLRELKNFGTMSLSYLLSSYSSGADKGAGPGHAMAKIFDISNFGTTKHLIQLGQNACDTNTAILIDVAEV